MAGGVAGLPGLHVPPAQLGDVLLQAAEGGGGVRHLSWLPPCGRDGHGAIPGQDTRRPLERGALGGEEIE